MGFSRLILAIGGAGMLLAGTVAVAIGLAAATWLRSILPPVAIDQAAIGGAAVTLGVLVGGIGLIQIGLAGLLRRTSGQRAWTAAAAGTLAGLLAALSVALAVVLATETAAGGPAWLLAGSAALLAIAVAYGMAALRITSR